MILSVLSSVYGAAASWRRRWYARDPARQRRLTKPVVSVGNLRVGGTGKTPVVAHLCELLLAHGERPAILTRGYGRTRPTDGVTIVSNGKQIIAGLASAGDEPLLLARLLPSVPILVGTDRFQCGQHAERDFDITVHVLDDGFQHTSLARDIDIVIVTPDDLTGRRLPLGRLRSPVSALADADAVIVDRSTDDARAEVARLVSADARVFELERVLGAPLPLEPDRGWSGEPRESTNSATGRRVIAFAGIAGPDRFADTLRASGWDVAELVAFPDHHRYERKDLDRVATAVSSTGAVGALTTEKDAMRLLRLRPLPVPIASIPGVERPTLRSAGFGAWCRNAPGSSTSNVRSARRFRWNRRGPHPPA